MHEQTDTDIYMHVCMYVYEVICHEWSVTEVFQLAQLSWIYFYL